MHELRQPSHRAFDRAAHRRRAASAALGARPRSAPIPRKEIRASRARAPRQFRASRAQALFGFRASLASLVRPLYKLRVISREARACAHVSTKGFGGTPHRRRASPARAPREPHASPAQAPREPRASLARAPRELRAISVRATRDLHASPSRAPRESRASPGVPPREPARVPREPRAIPARSPRGPHAIPTRAPREPHASPAVASRGPRASPARAAFVPLELRVVPWGPVHSLCDHRATLRRLRACPASSRTVDGRCKKVNGL